MSLSASLDKYKSEIADAASRNVHHSRPASSTPRTSTPIPAAADPKRTHDTAFASASNPPLRSGPAPAVGGYRAGTELLTQMWTAVNYLKEKDGKPIAFENLIGYLSLPLDARKNIPLIKRLLQDHPRVEFVPKADADSHKDSFKYRPIHPVTNADELQTFLARQPTALGVQVKNLKDGWPDCIAAIDALELEAGVLVIRNKKDDSPKFVWADSPTYHILNPATQLPLKIDPAFVKVWSQTKLPASETEIRTELEKAGLTPTSQVKEVKRVETKQKEKRRVNRKGGKTTNSHMLGHS